MAKGPHLLQALHPLAGPACDPGLQKTSHKESHMPIILSAGAIAVLAIAVMLLVGVGARVLWRSYANKRRIQMRLKQYASR